MSYEIASGSLLGRSIAKSAAPGAMRVALVALSVALTAAAAQVTFPVPFTTVPFVLTPLVVLLTGAALGSRLGFLTQVLYLMAGAAGLEVFAPSLTLPPGLARLVGPTAGYLWAYPIAAYVTGRLAERGWDRRYVTSAVAMMLGLALIFAGGVSWLAIGFTHSLPLALASGVGPFIVADIIKVLVAAMILPQTWRVVGNRL